MTTPPPASEPDTEAADDIVTRLMTFQRAAVTQQAHDLFQEAASEIAALRSRLAIAEGALTMHVMAERALVEDIEKLGRVARRAISASVTVMNDVARTKLLEAIEALPMRLRSTPTGSDNNG